ncbi:MAG: hypothetical protein INR62_11935 [Rhodospirillales bacterium]|nr:hypothetical protein [Acetobacter sp.]
MSYTTVAIILTLVAVLFYGAFVLYGTWIDGRRQAMREKGLHPTTDSSGHVHAREENDDAEER